MQLEMRDRAARMRVCCLPSLFVVLVAGFDLFSSEVVPRPSSAFELTANFELDLGGSISHSGLFAAELVFGPTAEFHLDSGFVLDLANRVDNATLQHAADFELDTGDSFSPTGLVAAELVSQGSGFGVFTDNKLDLVKSCGCDFTGPFAFEVISHVDSAFIELDICGSNSPTGLFAAMLVSQVARPSPKEIRGPNTNRHNRQVWCKQTSPTWTNPSGFMIQNLSRLLLKIELEVTLTDEVVEAVEESVERYVAVEAVSLLLEKTPDSTFEALDLVLSTTCGSDFLTGLSAFEVVSQGGSDFQLDLVLSSNRGSSSFTGPLAFEGVSQGCLDIQPDLGLFTTRGSKIITGPLAIEVVSQGGFDIQLDLVLSTTSGSSLITGHLALEAVCPVFPLEGGLSCN